MPAQHPDSPRQICSICDECGAPVSFPVGALQVRCEFCQAGLAVSKGENLVSLECPRCGGNFYYLDGSLCGRCPFCEANLLALVANKLLRFIIIPRALRPPEAINAQLIFLPFWHLKGLIFGVDIGVRPYGDRQEMPNFNDNNIDQETLIITDHQEQGPAKIFINRLCSVYRADPIALNYGVRSLRLRGEVFPLEPLKSSHEKLGQLIPAAGEISAIREELLNLAMNLGKPTEGMFQLDCQRRELISETYSLIYYPFWYEANEQRTRLWDGVNGDLEPLEKNAAQTEPASSNLFDELKLIELNCDNCGQPLPPGNRSHIFPCQNCGQFWIVTEQGLKTFEAYYARPLRSSQALIWIPFWRVPVEVTYDRKVARQATEHRTVLGLHVPPAAQDFPKATKNDPLCYFAPAFGAMKMPRLDYAARDMTRHQPAIVAGEAIKAQHYHCFHSSEDARRLAYITWLMNLPGSSARRLRSLRIKTAAPQLWYIPFERRGDQLVNLITYHCYDQQAFRGVRH